MRLTKTLVVLGFVLLAAAAGWGQTVPMTNDGCTTAIAVGDGINPGAPAGASGFCFTNVGATLSAGIPAACSTVNADVWFSWTPTINGVATIATCTPVGFAAGSLSDTVVQVLDASCPPTVSKACNDDFCQVLKSSLTVSVCAGVPVLIRVGSFDAGTGTFYLKITPPAPPPPPNLPNDDCTGAIPVALGANGPFSNAGAIGSGISASCAQSFHDVWFAFAATCTGPISVDTGCLGFDTVLSVHSPCPPCASTPNQLACNDDDPDCGFSSSLSFFAVAGQSYFIRVASFSAGSSGTFPINVGSGLHLELSSPLGPGSLMLAYSAGFPNGTYFFAATVVPGVYPNGWLFGLDISYAELASQIAVGFPFSGPLDACGRFVLGPIPGLPPGLTIYAIAFGFPQGSVVPTNHSLATSYTIP